MEGLAATSGPTPSSARPPSVNLAMASPYTKQDDTSLASTFMTST